jgi:uncharacterized DUF497 family protein
MLDRRLRQGVEGPTRASDRAEASRFTELRAFLVGELRRIDAQSAASARDGIGSKSSATRLGSDCPTLQCCGLECFDSTHVHTHTRIVRFSFDPAKQASKFKRHGFDLADARAVIESGQTVTFEDHRFDYSEERFVKLGPLGESLVAIVSAETEDHIRIISVRKADRHEQAIYRENTG